MASNNKVYFSLTKLSMWVFSFATFYMVSEGLKLLLPGVGEKGEGGEDRPWPRRTHHFCSLVRNSHMTPARSKKCWEMGTETWQPRPSDNSMLWKGSRNLWGAVSCLFHSRGNTEAGLGYGPGSWVYRGGNNITNSYFFPLSL